MANNHSTFKNIHTDLLIQQFNLVWENSLDGMRILDDNGNMILVNPAFCKLVGKSESELINQHFSIIYDPANKLIMQKKSSVRFKAHSVEPHLERELSLWNGNKVWFELSNSYLDFEDGRTMLLSIFRDISDRKKVEQELKQINENKDKFFSIIAHDLKSPFNSLLGYNNILIEDFDSLEKQEIKHFIENIYRITKNVYQLIENLLEYSRLQLSRINFQPIFVNLRNKVTDVLNLMTGNAIKKNITLLNNCEDKLNVKADENMLNSILMNLISNAIKFTRKNGQITIESEIVGNFIHIKIIDNGIGISTEDQAKLFKIGTNFTRTGTEKEQGTGLGLILCKEFAKKHDGDLWVESEEGKGSTFIISLPRVEE